MGPRRMLVLQRPFSDCPGKTTDCPKPLDEIREMGYTGDRKRVRTMKVEVRIDPGAEETRVVVHAPALTPEVEELLRRLEGETAAFAVLREGELVFLSRSDILRFYTDGKGVSCQTVEGVYSVRQRLYELEEELAGNRFVRVSNGEIVNLDRVTALDLSLSGTIKMTLSRGAAVSYASRRYVKKIKQTLGL